MAKLSQLPGQAIIDGLKGTVDFYYWKGIPVARSWPRKTTLPPSPAMLAAQQTFAKAAILYKEQDRVLILYLKDNASSTAKTSKDIFFMAYLSGLPTEVYQGER